MYDFRAAGIGQDPDGRPDLAKPSLVLTAGEAFRIPCEYAGSLLLDTLDAVRRRGPRAGRPVLVVPGFHATDGATRRLRGHLRAARLGRLRLGRRHQPRARPTRCSTACWPASTRCTATTSEPVSLVGWSFGGLLARWLAHQRPEHVRQVVTLGSPWRPEGERTRTTRMFERSRRTHGLSERAEEVIDELREPLLVFSTAIWSKTDGIVPWRGCALDDGARRRENIAVPSSHIGLVSNPLALAVARPTGSRRTPTRPSRSAGAARSGWRRDREEGRREEGAREEGAGQEGRQEATAKKTQAKKAPAKKAAVPEPSARRVDLSLRDPTSARCCRSCGW